MKKIKRNQKGITLIALIITIIVLLILAGVSISIIVGDNGILNNAQTSVVKSTIAQESERIQMSVFSARTDEKKGYVKLTFNKFKSAIDKEFGIGKILITGNNNGMFVLFSKDSKKTYVIENGENVIDENNMRKIYTEAELASFRDDVNNGNSYEGKYIILMNDITLVNSWNPIGNSEDNSFKGTFIGNGYTVANVNVNVDNNAGFFGFAENANINGLKINGTIQSDLLVDGKRAGGLIAIAKNVNISNCTNNAMVSGSAYVGGFVGIFKGGMINNCVNNGNVISQNYVSGGIVGALLNKVDKAIVMNCGNTGLITSKNSSKSFVGGLIGTVMDTSVGMDIFNSYNIGNIVSDKVASGLLGEVNCWKPITIANCYSACTLTGTVNCGLINATHFWIGTENFTLRNLFWMSATDCVAFVKMEGNPPTLNKTPESTIKSEAFVQDLNNNREDDSWMEWELNSNNFPVIKR